MHLSNVIKAIAILAPVVSAFVIPILPSSSVLDFSPRKMFSFAAAPDKWIADSFVPDTSAYYRLTNQYTGPKRALDVIDDDKGLHKLKIEDIADNSSQFWKFSERKPGKYDLSTLWLGPDKTLDVINNAGVDSTSVHLADEGNYSGQFWTITPWGDGSWRLTNDFTGPGKHLDVYSDTKEGFLDGGNHSGQHWYFTKIE